MASMRRGLQGIRTLGALHDNRRARTPGSAFLELASLANEKHMLQQELERSNRRQAEIGVRLDEIRVKEEKLAGQTHVPNLNVGAVPSTNPRHGSTSAPERSHRVRTTEIQY